MAPDCATRYRARSPRATPLYRLFDAYFDKVRGHENSGAPVAPVETFDPLEFLARVIMHIPEPRRHLVRYYGAYSNASRASGD